LIGKVSFAAAAAVFVAASVSAQSGAPSIDPIFAAWSRPDGPGCAVAAARDGRTVFSRAFGSADLEHGVVNTPATIFEAGSVSKQFTAAAILLLAEDGRLALTDDVRRYVPELPGYPATLTIDHLLSHTSGLRDWGVVAQIGGWPRGSRAHTNADALAIIARQRSLNYEPGAEYSYTNSGYNLLAIIVERVSGSSLAEFTRTRLFEPLGMRSTSWRDDFRRVVPGRAVAYGRDGEAWQQQMPFEDAYGNGGLLTTVGDLLVWNEALASGRLGQFLGAELQRRASIAGGQPIAYARGLFVNRYRDAEEVAHSGSTGGYRAWLGRYPAQSLSIALLCNAADADATKLARQVADRFMAPAAPVLANPSADAMPFAGLWVNERTGIPIRLVAEDGFLRLADGPVLETLPERRFGSPAGTFAFLDEATFRFTAREGGEVIYRRAEPWTPGIDDLRALEELYRSAEADASYRARVEHGVLTLRHTNRPELAIALRPAYRDVFEFDGGIVRVQRGVSGRAYSLSFGMPRVRDLRFERLNSAGDNDAAAAVSTSLGFADRAFLRLDLCSTGDSRRQRRVRSLALGMERTIQRARNLFGERLLREGWRLDGSEPCDDSAFRAQLIDARQQMREANRLMDGALRP
jgi:CubicO group peptidase (beta-lactamase class C family)